MILKNKDKEIQLQYTIGSFTNLKKILKCDNLRNTLLQAAKKEDYETLAKAIKEFAGGEIPKTDAVYPMLDGYIKENGGAYYDLFLQFICEIGEAGFFKEKATVQELDQLAQSPDLDLDMESLTGEAMQLFKGEMLHQMVKQMAGSNTMTIGAATSTTSGPSLIKAE